MEKLEKLKKAELIELLKDKEFEIGALRAELTVLREAVKPDTAPEKDNI
jgi:hypothetical protein